MPPDSLRVLTWNAHGWAQKYHLPVIQRLFQDYDLLFISEAWIKHAVLPTITPPNFEAVYTSYPESLQGRVNGGLIVYHRTSIEARIIQFSKETWKPIVWVEVANLILAGAYLPHENSNYLTHWEIDPIEELYTQAERYAEKYPNHGVAIMGDFNARRNLAPHDHRWTPRGRLLHNNLPEDWIIHAEGPTMQTHDLHTSCVDYIILSPTAQLQNPLCETHGFDTYSDHAKLSLFIEIEPIQQTTPEPLPHKRPPPPTIKTPLDLAEEALLATTTKDPSFQEAFNFQPDTTTLNRAKQRHKTIVKYDFPTPAPT